mmetsp:Transcript_20999/g.28549  ORF Transcript_20999/g.28549 Transcript_20999/m.28549 type:complete len:112 (-) Transcript_20999:227-562(-)
MVKIVIDPLMMQNRALLRDEEDRKSLVASSVLTPQKEAAEIPSSQSRRSFLSIFRIMIMTNGVFPTFVPGPMTWFHLFNRAHDVFHDVLDRRTAPEQLHPARGPCTNLKPE